MKITSITILVALSLFAMTAGFSGQTGRRETSIKLVSAPKVALSRSAFVAGLAGAFLAPNLAFAVESNAKESNKESKGNTKNCMDLCLYECTKHGMSKGECVPECKKQCKTERGQRIMATPITEKGVDYN
jgi:hypothetical protein